MIAALFATLAALLVLGVPVAFAIGLAGVIAALANGQIPLAIVPQRAFAALDSWALMAVPLFVLAGELMNASGISRRVIGLIGRIRGGLPVASVLSSMFFAGISGSSSADTAAVGSIMIPAMVRRGYPPAFAAALQAAGGAIGPIIPPSIIMIVMGFVTGTSIAALFVGGIVPGVLVGMALIAASYGKARRYESPEAAGTSSLSLDAWRALPALAMPVVILGGILAGVFTATEAAAVAVGYSLLVGMVLYRELRVGQLGPILVSAALRSCVVMFVATGAYLVAWIVAVGRVPAELGVALEGWGGGPLGFLLAANLLLLLVGMVMESIAVIIVMMPVLFPLAQQLGIDPVHFGVVMSVNLCIGMVTPPYGATLFVACTLSGRSVSDVTPWLMKPLLAMIVVLGLITLVPWTVTGLPRWFGLM